MYISGKSIGGIETSIQIKSLNLMFDIGYIDQYGIDNIFITHPHGDHISQLFKFLGIRELMFKDRLTTIYILEDYFELLNDSIENYKILSTGEYNIKVIPFGIGDSFNIGKYSIKSIPNSHRIPSSAFTIYENVKCLKPEFQGLSSEQIIELKKNGMNISDSYIHNLLSFSGDTTYKFFELSPHVLESKILITECTYYGSDCDKAYERGHLDFNTLFSMRNKFKNKVILLSHYSGKYDFNFLQNTYFSDEEKFKLFQPGDF